MTTIKNLLPPHLGNILLHSSKVCTSLELLDHHTLSLLIHHNQHSCIIFQQFIEQSILPVIQPNHLNQVW